MSDLSDTILVDALFESLEPAKRKQVLAETLKKTIACQQDEASVPLIRRLRDAFGLGPDVDIRDIANKRGVSASEVYFELKENRRHFSDLLMAIYPFGSIREADRRAYPTPTSKFRKTRRAMVEHVVAEWDGAIDMRGTLLFEFLRKALTPTERHVILLDDELDMVLAPVRGRLECTIVFTEPVLRKCLVYMMNGKSRWTTNDSNLYMTLAMARTRNGGVDVVMQDVSLREEEERRQPKDAVVPWQRC